MCVQNAYRLLRNATFCYSANVLGHRKFVRGNNMVLEYVVDG